MSAFLTYTKQPWSHHYSEILDVRSESEFTEDRIPGAINLPVLTDPQREKVGTIYKQIDPFEARKVGAVFVAENIATYLTDHFASKDKHYRPLVYCWRGGQRSGSLAGVLLQIGWTVTVLEGGYKTYRALVRQHLAELPQTLTFRVLCGRAGTGKTEILRALRQRGSQVLDLEALANHRGSLLGSVWTPQAFSPAPQPSQKYFESLLLQALQGFDPRRPIWVESESNKIGKVYLPKSLWDVIKQSRGIVVETPLAGRIQRISQEYPHFREYPNRLKDHLQRLKSRYGRGKFREWEHWIDTGQGANLVGDLLTTHYDPAYQWSLKTAFPNVDQQFFLPDASETHLNSLLEHLQDFEA